MSMYFFAILSSNTFYIYKLSRVEIRHTFKNIIKMFSMNQCELVL